MDLSRTGAGTDLLLYLRAARLRPLIAHVPEPLAFFRAHSGSITIGARAREVALSYALTKSLFAGEIGREDLIPTILAWHWLGLIRDTGRPISPAAAAKDYRGLVTPARLVTAATGIIVRLGIERLRGARDHVST